MKTIRRLLANLDAGTMCHKIIVPLTIDRYTVCNYGYYHVLVLRRIIPRYALSSPASKREMPHSSRSAGDSSHPDAHVVKEWCLRSCCSSYDGGGNRKSTSSLESVVDSSAVCCTGTQLEMMASSDSTVALLLQYLEHFVVVSTLTIATTIHNGPFLK